MIGIGMDDVMNVRERKNMWDIFKRTTPKSSPGWPLVWKTWKCQGLTAVREILGILLEVREMSGNCQGKILSGKSCLKRFIVRCIFVSIQVFSTSTSMIWVTFNMLSATEECRKLSGNYQGISHCPESGHLDCGVMLSVNYINSLL